MFEGMGNGVPPDAYLFLQNSDCEVLWQPLSSHIRALKAECKTHSLLFSALTQEMFSKWCNPEL